MFAYFVRRLVSLVPTLVFVSMLIFGLQQLLPGDPALMLAGEDQRPGRSSSSSAQKLHLDEPLPVQYGYWIGGVLQRRSRRIDADPVAGARPDPAEAAGDGGAGACCRC